ncbi:MAG: B12-binding domain-containing radical SAM protein [Candidatus Binatia bacterium]
MAVRGKRMRVLLVQPTTVHLDHTPLKSRRRFIMGLMTPLIAGLTPPDVDVELCDERLEDINFNGGYDLVGMTTTIGSALRAYQLADEFRRRGVLVVMGGFHASLLPQETLQHADAVVVGEADLVWEQVLQDAVDGKLRPIYKAEKLHDLKGLPRPRHELLKLNRYLFKAIPIQATRGCPYRCSFCEIPVFYGGAFRTRPVDDVIKEIREVIKVTGLRNFQFIDDQIAGKHQYAKDLFHALAPEKIKFSCLWTINTNHDEELLDLAAKAGVYHVNIGVESISQGSLKSIEKVQNHAGEYKRLLARLRSYGIFYSLNFLFGLDDDREGIFDETIRFLDEVKAPVAFFNTVTPRRGTPMRTQLEQEGRVIIPDADQFTNNHRCMFVPKNLTPQQVEEGVWRCTERFYSMRSIVRRLLLPPNAYTGQGIPSNLYFYWGAKRRIDPVDYY